MDVVILHGWRLSGATFAPLARMLTSKGYHVFTPDLPGFGVSKNPDRPYHVDDYARFVERFIQKNKIKKCIVIGHSFGGRVAIKLAARHPELIERLVLTGVPGFLPVPKSRVMLFLVLAKLGTLIFGNSILAPFADVARRLLYRFARASDYLKVEGVMRETFINVIRDDLTSSMEKINRPTRLVWGANEMVVPVAVGRKMVTVIPGATLSVIPNEGHRVPYVNPELFIQHAQL